MTDRIVELKQRIVDAQEYNRKLEAYIEHLESKLEAFFTGDVPQNATFDHMILAKYGRIRLTEKSKVPALLSNQQQG